ncbi:TIM44-like domain-containing protein [Desulfocurvus sp. DL9XJH121]
MRLTPFDVLIVGILVYFLVRTVLRRRGGGNDSRRPPRPPRTQNGEDPRREAAQAYERAQRAWDMLRDTPPDKEALRPGNAPFDEEEFLAGAKAMCARVRQSWDSRDLDDLEQFCTPEMMNDFKRRANVETRSPRSEPLLIEAGLVERAARQDETEEAAVLYRVMEKEPGSGETKETKEIWRYVRRTDTPGDMWRLKEIGKPQ